MNENASIEYYVDLTEQYYDQMLERATRFVQQYTEWLNETDKRIKASPNVVNSWLKDPAFKYFPHLKDRLDRYKRVSQSANMDARTALRSIYPRKTRS